MWYTVSTWSNSAAHSELLIPSHVLVGCRAFRWLLRPVGYCGPQTRLAIASVLNGFYKRSPDNKPATCSVPSCKIFTRSESLKLPVGRRSNVPKVQREGSLSRFALHFPKPRRNSVTDKVPGISTVKIQQRDATCWYLLTWIHILPK